MAIQGIKAIPGINIAGAVLNATIAGSMVVALGEASIYIFEQISLGNKSVDDIDWVNKIVKSKLTNELIKKLTVIFENNDGSISAKTIVNLLIESFKKSK